MLSLSPAYRVLFARSLTLLFILFASLLPAVALASSVENNPPSREARSGLPFAPLATFVVTNTDDSGAGSLRQAIDDANGNPGADTITFAIGAVGSQQTISPTSFLPFITDTVTIDGWSQGGAGYSGPPLIAIDGALAGEVDGLTLDYDYYTGYDSSSSLIRGLAIIGFAHNGFRVNSSYNKIQGNYIGLGLDGATAQGNGNIGDPGYPDRWGGIYVYGLNNLIGTDGDGTLDAAERNVVSGNRDGIDLSYTISNVVVGNYVGTDAAGLNAVPNLSIGIFVEGISNRIGTDGNGLADAAERNIISGNSGVGVFLRSSLSNTVAGNFIGLNVAGDPLGNGTPGGEGNGIVVFASHGNIIGTDGSPDAFNANERNVIAATVGDIDLGDGILILYDAIDNVVAGNYIGVNEEGTTIVGYGNARAGITIDHANSNRIGTNADGVADDDEANLIGGNYFALWLREAMSNTVSGNLIGTDATGLLDLGNFDGVGLENSSYNLIGGSEPAAGNVIRHTFDPGSGAGIILWYSSSRGSDPTNHNSIIGNLIADNRKDGIASFPTEYPSTPPGDGPNDNFIISNTIRNNRENGLYNVGSSPLIQDNLIIWNFKNGIRNEVYPGSTASQDYVSRPDIVSNTIENNSYNGIDNSGASPSIRDNIITSNSLSGINNEADADHLSLPDIFSNTISNNCYVGPSVACAGIFSLDTAPNNASTLELDNAPAPNHAYPFIDQRWYGAVEVIQNGIPIASSVVLSSANGGPIYAFSATAGPCSDYNNTILHGGSGINCDEFWPVITQYIVDETGVRHNYMPVTSSSPAQAVYSFDADAATDPTDTGAGFSGEGIPSGPFSRHQIMQITINDSISGFAVTNSSPTALGSPTIFTATVSSGANITYTWDFGDGYIVAGGPFIVSHTYSTSAFYTATITATNAVSIVMTTTPVTITGPTALKFAALTSQPRVSDSWSTFGVVLVLLISILLWQFVRQEHKKF
jgi:hypothetical protein